MIEQYIHSSHEHGARIEFDERGKPLRACTIIRDPQPEIGGEDVIDGWRPGYWEQCPLRCIRGHESQLIQEVASLDRDQRRGLLERLTRGQTATPRDVRFGDLGANGPPKPRSKWKAKLFVIWSDGLETELPDEVPCEDSMSMGEAQLYFGKRAQKLKQEMGLR